MEKANTKEQHKIPAPTAISDKELRDARQVVNIFILAWKNYGLYPEDHVSTVKSIENLVAAFNDFFTNHGDLKLTVEKDCLLYQSEIIYKVSQEGPSEDINTLLYRDGIKWIEFQEGLPPGEIACFFRIAFKYRLFAEETEGDIVTALMDEEFEYIDFKAVDIYWQDLLLINFSQLHPPAPPPEKAADQNEADTARQPTESEVENIYARSVADPSISDAQLELTDTDYKTLQQMVKEEESWNISDDLFELLLIMLGDQSEQEKFAEVLGFISEVAFETIEVAKFDLLAKLLQALHKQRSPEISPQQDWKHPLVDRFFRDLSRPEIFKRFSEKLLQLQTSEIEKLASLEQVLHHFSPQIIPFLVPVIMQSGASEIQQLVAKAIVRLSRLDIGPLEKIAAQHGPEMGNRLLVILNYLKGDRVNGILFQMCQHPSNNKVRRKAINELVARDPRYTPRLFSLIDDPSQEIRACILSAIAKHRSSVLENLLLNYLQGNSPQKEPDHILACYKALGCCGSDTAVPFLRRILLRSGWLSFMGSGKAVFRDGAAIALALIDTPDAKNVLQKASKSRFKVIRKAFERTETMSILSGKKTDG